MDTPPKELKIKASFETTSEKVPDTDTSRMISNRNTYIAASAPLLYGVVTGMLGAFSAPGTVDMGQPGSRFRYTITSDDISWIASIPYFSGIFGNGLAGYIIQKFGRKTVMMNLSIVYVISFLIVAYAPTVKWVIAGRAIGGICGGICASTIPPYVIEISSSEIRGVMASVFGVSFNLGGLLIMVMGIYWRWSWLAVASAGMAIVAAFVLLFMPESPPWLVSQSKMGEAAHALRFLRGKNADVKKELDEIRENLSNQEQGMTWKEVIEPTFYKPLIIGLILMAFFQFSGVYAILSYAVEVFEDLGSSIQPNIGSVILALVSLLGNSCSGLLLDRFGRRPMYFLSSICATLAYLSLGIYSYVVFKYDTDPKIYGWIPLICFVTVIFSCGLGIACVPYLVINELVSVRSRSTLVAVCSLSGSFFAFMVTRLFDSMRSAMGIHGVYWTYGSVTLLSCVYCYFFLPETKGLTLNEILKFFNKHQIISQ